MNQLELFTDDDTPIWWACGIPGSREHVDWWPWGDSRPSAGTWQLFYGTRAQIDALTIPDPDEGR
jgi:hypothetical protein